MIVALLASALFLFGGQSPIQPQPHPSCKRAHHHCQVKWDHRPYTYTTRSPTSDGGTVIARCRVNPRTGVTSCWIIGYTPHPQQRKYQAMQAMQVYLCPGCGARGPKRGRCADCRRARHLPATAPLKILDGELLQETRHAHLCSR
jgi:hypothetical protein